MSGGEDCRQVENLLDSYVLGELSEEDANLVESHLQECEACRERITLIAGLAKAVRDQEKAGLGYHIPSETITDLALDPDAMEPGTRAEALEHLRLCEDCTRYYRIAVETGAELGQSDPAYGEDTSAAERRGATRQFLSPRWAAAWATAAVAVAAIVYFLILRSELPSIEEPERGMAITQEAVPPESLAHLRGEPARAAGWTAWPALVAEAEQALGEGNTDIALALTDSAWHLAITAYDEATGQYQSASLRDSVMTVYFFNDYAEAESLLVQIRRVKERALGPDHPDLALDWHDLALLYGRQWRHSESVPFYQRSLEIRENSLDPLHPALSLSVMTLAEHYAHLGRYDEAEPLFKRALDLREKIYRPQMAQSPDAARLLANVHDELAHVYRKTGRYVEAERLYKESLEIRLAFMADTHPATVGAVYSYLGSLYWTLGGESRAESLYTAAVALQIKEHGPNHPEVATGLSQVAMVKAARGDYEEAEDLYKWALEIRETTVAKDTPGGAHPGIAMSCHNLASLYTETGRYDEAEPFYERALDVWNQAFGFEHPRSVSTMSDYAYNCLRLRDYERAEVLYARALAISEETYGPLSPNVAAVLESMCLLYRKEGRADEAISLAEKAMRARKANFAENAVFLAETDALTFSHHLRRSVANYVSCFVDAGAPRKRAAEVADLILRNKGPVSDAIFERQQSLLSDGGPEALNLASSLKNIRSQLAQYYVVGPAQDAGDFVSRIDSLEALASDLESRLAGVSSAFRKRYDPGEVGARALSSLLPEKTGLVEYFRYDYIDPETEESIPTYAALVLRKGYDAKLFDLGEAASIDEYINDYQQHMAYVDYEGGNPSKADEAWYDRISAGLYDSVWKDIEKAVGGAEMVMVAPDGSLNMLAFGGLKAASGRYLIESVAFHYLTSARDLVRLGEKYSPGAGLLAMGDPDYGASESEPESGGPTPGHEPILLAAHVSRGALPTCDEFTAQRPIPLAGTRGEIEVVETSWRDHTAEPAVVYLGDQATESRFKQESAGKRVIHLAAHGYLLGSICGSESRQKFGMEDRYFARANPLVLSGLYLAGANKTLEGAAEPGGEDGILTAYEVSALDLNGTRLVVLSACRTALGKVEEGEGTYGLRRAFQMAGVRTVVSTLWPIPDKATSEMMGALYVGWEGPISLALQRVQLERLRALRASGETDHPYSWAAFMATGDWR